MLSPIRDRVRKVFRSRCDSTARLRWRVPSHPTVLRSSRKVTAAWRDRRDDFGWRLPSRALRDERRSGCTCCRHQARRTCNAGVPKTCASAPRRDARSSSNSRPLLEPWFETHLRSSDYDRCPGYAHSPDTPDPTTGTTPA